MSELHTQMFQWWRKHGRMLPWRLSIRSLANGEQYQYKGIESYFESPLFRDPYRVVVSEIMLQQTQVDRVLTKYTQWMNKWPTIDLFSLAKLSEVIVEWKGLGYNRRARFLWLLGKEISEKRKGDWPKQEKELMKLSGIGRYTARAVMSFAMGQQVGVVDTNVKRILSRWFAKEREEKNEKAYFSLADEILPEGFADPWNQALMDFGALVCTAKNPKCDACPVAQLCEANQQAVNEGYENYAQKIKSDKTTEESKKEATTGKDFKDGKKLKFEETDRYLRGRIVDCAREKEWTKEELIKYLSNKYIQFNSARIEENIQRLVLEEMIELSKE